jgi:hypothetical protein
MRLRKREPHISGLSPLNLSKAGRGITSRLPEGGISVDAPSSYRPSQLPRRFPVGATYVVEGVGGAEGHLRVIARYVVLPGGRRINIPALRLVGPVPPLKALPNQRYATPVETKPMTSTSLAELLDPDKWIASGKNLTDFPWPDGANEREAMKLILCARPMLNAHVERWSKLVMKTLGRRGGENVGDVFVEEYLRELWERARVARLA